MNSRVINLISPKYLGGNADKGELIDKIGICVYFVSDGEYIKIGVASSLSNRLNELQTGNAKRLIPMYAIKANTQRDALKTEKELHNTFKTKNVLGEWFKINEEDILEYVKEKKIEIIKPIYKYDTRLKINRA